MSQGYGYAAYAGIGVESTYGTAVAGSKWFQILSESIKASRKLTPNKSLGFLSMGRTTRARAIVAGGLSMVMHWNGFERIIADAMGASSITTTGANPYTHTGALKAAMPTGLTVLVNRDAANVGTGSMRQLVGCHISKLKFSQKLDEPLIIEPEFVGSNFSNVNIQAPTYPTWDVIDYGHLLTANMDDNGTPYGFKLVSLDLEIDNKLEPKMYLTDFKSGGVHRVDQRQVTFSSEIEFDSLSALAAFDAATEHDYKFEWRKDAAVSTVNVLTMTIPKAFLDEAEPQVGGPGPIRLTLKGNAEFSAADNDELSIVLKNTSSSI